MFRGAGKIDRTITIQRAAGSVNALNESQETWSDLVKVRASRRDVSDGEQVQAGDLGSFRGARFVVRWSETIRTITPKDRLSGEGGVWSIHGVKETLDGRQRFIEITAVRDND